MTRKAFHQLLKRYIDGKCTEAEKHLIDQWYLLLDETSAMPESEEAINNIEEKLWNKIHDGVNLNKKLSQKKYKLALKISVAAAVSAALICLGVFYFSSTKKISNSVQEALLVKGFRQIKNETSAVQKVVLEDSSIVSLEPGATLTFPKKFETDKREVFLEGVAKFKVSKNPERPFYVYDDNIVTQVLGTSFIIKKINQQIEVDVLTGKVAVFENSKYIKQNNKTNGVVVTPNQKVTYYTSNHQFVTSLVENPVPVPQENKAVKETPAKEFMYDDEAVSKVINDLRQEYKIDIIIENEKINRCSFTGDIKDQSLYNKLDLLCQAIQANYEIRGTSIVIDGKGCD